MSIRRTKLLSSQNLGILLFQILLTILLLGNKVSQAGLILGFVLVFSGVAMLFKKNGPSLFTSLIFAFSPFIGFLRQNIISYNGISFILIFTIILWIYKNNSTALLVLRSKRVLGVFVFFMLFILYGVLIGSPLERFMKYFETALAIVVFSMYLRDTSYFRKYAPNFILSSILLVLALAQNASTRFIFEDDSSTEVKADPSALGIALVFSLLLVVVDDGRWLFLIYKRSVQKIKYLIVLIIFILLVITTSRIGFITLVGTLLIWSFLKLKNAKSFALIFLTGIVGFYYINSSIYASLVEQWVDKTINNQNGIAGATTGRAEQWAMVGEYIDSENLSVIMFGYGPGNGPKFSEKYSLKVNVIDSMYGKAYELHSLYLGVLVEFGMLAFLIFIFFLIKMVFLNFKFSLNGLSDLPIVGSFVYLFYIFSVSGLGIIPGLLIAIFINPKNFQNVRFKTA